MTDFKRIRTVLYDDQRITRAELELLHTHMFQRLYGLHQLGLTDRVFIDASHSRLHHVVGVLEQVTKLVDAVIRNLKRSPATAQLRYGAEGASSTITAREFAERVSRALPIARLIGFLHDLTHAPFGHTIEDEIGLIASKHDDPPRQADAYYRLICQLIGWLAFELSNTVRGKAVPADLMAFLSDPEVEPLPSVTTVIDTAATILSLDATATQPFWRVRPDEVLTLLAQLHVAMTALLHLELLHVSKPEVKHVPAALPYDFQNVIEVILARTGKSDLLRDIRFHPQRDAYLLDIVGNTVCADILDYAQRDAHYANLKLNYDADRIAEGFTLASWDPYTYKPDKQANCERRCPAEVDDPFRGRSIRTAISLFSHKLRTDVPGELMNLLNVRFYLYERAIYHPTKTAAGAMLGTALQLLWWHGASSSREGSDILPTWLRFVSDDVFVSVVHRATKIAQAIVREIPQARALAGDYPAPKAASPEYSLALHILQTNKGRACAAVRDDLAAANSLLTRLCSRRYFRPVFRALPDVANPTLDLDADDMANLFKQPGVRFDAERGIEQGANLPRGSIVIHCPRLNTAEKVANVLLVMPEVRGERGIVSGDRVRKLRHIGAMTPIFKAHERAITAVEKMYQSMWRLVVYVAPEYFDRWTEIAMVAGKVLYNALDADQRNPDGTLENDVMLTAEIQHRFDEAALPEAAQQQKATGGPDDASLDAAAEIVLAAINSRDGAVLIDSAGVREKLEVVIRDLIDEPSARLRARMSALMDAAKPHFGKIDDELQTELYDRVGAHVAVQADADFVDLLRKVKSIAEGTPNAGRVAARGGKRAVIDEFVQFVIRSSPSEQKR